MPNRQERYTTTRTSKENCTERMKPSGTIRYAADQYLPYKHSVPALIRRCDDLPSTITHVPVAAVLVLNTPDDGRLRPKHVE